MTGTGSALTLTVGFAGLVIYASLYPFSGWFWPAGQPLSALLVPLIIAGAVRLGRRLDA